MSNLIDNTNIRGLVTVAFKLPVQNSLSEISARRVRVGNSTYAGRLCHIGFYEQQPSIYAIHRGIIIRADIENLVNEMVMDLVDNILPETNAQCRTIRRT